MNNKSIFHRVNRHAIIIGLVSFFMNFSSALIISRAIDFSAFIGAEASTVVLARQIGEGAGYLGRFLVGFISDIIGDRRKLLLMGYGTVITIKPLFILCSLDLLSNFNRILVFNTTNISEKFFGSLRDPVRDAWLADYTATEDLSVNISIRRLFSYLGSTTGALLSCFMSYKLTYTRLFTIAAIPAFLGILLLFNGVHNHSDLKAQNKKSNLYGSFINDVGKSGYQKTMLFLFLGVFLIFVGKVNELALWIAGKKSMIQISNSLLFLIFYLFSCFSSMFIPFLIDRVSPYLLMISVVFVFMSLNGFIYFGLSPSTLVFSTIYYGIFNAFIDILPTFLVMRTFHKTHWKATVSSILNLVIGIACGLGGFIEKKLINSYGILKPFSLSFIPMSLGIICLIYAYFLSKNIQNKHNN